MGPSVIFLHRAQNSWWLPGQHGGEEVARPRCHFATPQPAQLSSWINTFGVFFGLHMALLIDQLKMWQESGWQRGGMTHSIGSQERSRTWGRCSEDKASVHGTPALPSELNGATWINTYFPIYSGCVIVICIYCDFVLTDFSEALPEVHPFFRSKGFFFGGGGGVLFS